MAAVWPCLMALVLSIPTLSTLTLATLAWPTAAQAQEAGRTISLLVGENRRLDYGRDIVRTAVGSGEVADVRVVNGRQLLVTGLGPGVTSLSVWFSGRRTPQAVTLEVRPAAARGLEEEYELQASGGQASLYGETRSLERHDQALARFGDAPPLDATQQSGPVQVQTDIRVVEVNRSRLQSYGFFLGRNNGGNTQYAVGPTNSGSSYIDDGSLVAPLSEGFSIISGNDDGYLGAISALRNNGFAYTLAEPSLVTLSGQSASFLAGGEFPYPSNSSDGDVSVDFKEYGIRLQLTPTVLDDRRIMLKVAPEVSELDFTQAVQSSGISVPSLSVRRTDTTIQLGDGESFIISGLVSQSTMQSVDKFPGLGDLPVIGAFFRSTQFERDEKELIMIVTPHLVSPISAGVELDDLPGEALGRYDPSFLELLFDPQDAREIERLGDVGFSR
ncbi:type II and III secretion system protein family protein [Halomonas getboli]|uniref:type II and III secretion system protein family protein n=1 Tax=Halomonas getboli TaxID=2935862 RepID=UPI001FFF85F7|nr:type II and III secretion system protein family protein [Halomonas getboli]MCK2183437.1 type II and III secretion system protein family protein [Halomonas getboli]